MCLRISPCKGMVAVMKCSAAACISIGAPTDHLSAARWSKLFKWLCLSVQFRLKCLFLFETSLVYSQRDLYTVLVKTGGISVETLGIRHFQMSYYYMACRYTPAHAEKLANAVSCGSTIPQIASIVSFAMELLRMRHMWENCVFCSYPR